MTYIKEFRPYLKTRGSRHSNLSRVSFLEDHPWSSDLFRDKISLLNWKKAKQIISIKTKRFEIRYLLCHQNIIEYVDTSKFFNIFYLDYWFPKSIILYPCVLRTFYRRAKSPTVHFNQEDTRPCERFTNNRLLKHHFLTNITFSSPWLFILHWESESPIVSRIYLLI